MRGRKAWIRREAGEKKEAARDLAQVLKDFPGYPWGWNVLLAWIEEDRDWELAKTLLGPLPAQMLSDVSFRLKRLQVLEKAKADAASIDAEWAQLLDDFPENVPLYLNRYDSLHEAGSSDEATTILVRIAPYAEDDSYFLARLVDVRCREGNFAEALDRALRVCFAPVEQSTWPVNHVWEALGTANKEEKLAQVFRSRVEEGARPTPRALARFTEWTVDQERPGGFLRVLRQTRLHHVTRDTLSLMQAVERSSWRSEFSLGDVFATLNKHRYPRLVVKLWNRMCDRGPDGDSEEWAQAGRAMVNLGQKAKARELFRDWRKRRGLKMWSLANYLECLPRFRKEGLHEVIGTCRDALAQLPHDHCARYLTVMQAEASGLIGDKEGLLKVWQERRPYFGGELRSDEYFRTEYKYLIYDIPDLVDALQRDDRKMYLKILWRLRFKRLWNQGRRAMVRNVLAWVVRLAVLWWVIANVSGVFPR